MQTSLESGETIESASNLFVTVVEGVDLLETTDAFLSANKGGTDFGEDIRIFLAQNKIKMKQHTSRGRPGKATLMAIAIQVGFERMVSSPLPVEDGKCTWHEEFVFSQVAQDEKILVSCLNAGTGRHGARVAVPLSRLPKDQIIEQWYQLLSVQPNAPPIRSAVRLRFCYGDEGFSMRSFRSRSGSFGHANSETQSGYSLHGLGGTSTSSQHNSGTDPSAPDVSEMKEEADDKEGSSERGSTTSLDLLEAKNMDRCLRDIKSSKGSFYDSQEGCKAENSVDLDDLAELRYVSDCNTPVTQKNRTSDSFYQLDLEESGYSDTDSSRSACEKVGSLVPITGSGTIRRGREDECGLDPRSRTSDAFISQSNSTGDLSDKCLPAGLVDYFLVVGPDADYLKKIPQRIREGTQRFGGTVASEPSLPSVTEFGDQPNFDEAVLLERFPYNDHPDVPFPYKVEWFCFPDGLWLEKTANQPSPRIRSFAMHAGEMHLFAISLHFWEPVERIETEPSERIWIPLCICLLTRMPILDSLKLWLHKAHQFIQSSTGFKNSSSFEEYVIQLTLEAPVPIPGLYNVSLDFLGTKIPFGMPDPHQLPAAPFPLSPFLRVFGPRNCVQLWSLALCEAKFLFHCRNLALLPVMCEGLLTLLYPFQWVHPYVPVLPRFLVEYIQAPLPFILGFHSEWIKEIPEDLLSDVVLVDCDRGTFHLPSSSDYPVFPVSIEKKLVNSITEFLAEQVLAFDGISSLVDDKPALTAVQKTKPLKRLASMRDGTARSALNSSTDEGSNAETEDLPNLYRAHSSERKAAKGNGAFANNSADEPFSAETDFSDAGFAAEGMVASSASDTELSSALLSSASVPQKNARKQAFLSEAQIEVFTRLEFCRVIVGLLFDYTECLFYVNQQAPTFNACHFIDTYSGDEERPLLMKIIQTQTFHLHIESQDAVQLKPFFDLLEQARQESRQLGHHLNKQSTETALQMLSLAPSCVRAGKLSHIEKVIAGTKKSKSVVLDIPLPSYELCNNILKDGVEDGEAANPDSSASKARRKSNFWQLGVELSERIMLTTDQSPAYSKTQLQAQSPTYKQERWGQQTSQNWKYSSILDSRRLKYLLEQQRAYRPWTVEGVSRKMGINLERKLQKMMNEDGSKMPWNQNKRDCAKTVETITEESDPLRSCLQRAFASEFLDKGLVNRAEQLLFDDEATQDEFLQILQPNTRNKVFSGPRILGKIGFETLERLGKAFLTSTIKEGLYHKSAQLIELCGNFYWVRDSKGKKEGTSVKKNGEPNSRTIIDNETSSENRPQVEFLSTRLEESGVYTKSGIWTEVLEDFVQNLQDAPPPNQSPPTKVTGRTRCLREHDLETYPADVHGRYRCDICQISIQQGTQVLSCRYCDYDVCHACHSKVFGANHKHNEVAYQRLRSICKKAKDLFVEMRSLGVKLKEAEDFVKLVSEKYNLPEPSSEELHQNLKVIWAKEPSKPVSSSSLGLFPNSYKGSVQAQSGSSPLHFQRNSDKKRSSFKGAKKDMHDSRRSSHFQADDVFKQRPALYSMGSSDFDYSNEDKARQDYNYRLNQDSLDSTSGRAFHKKNTPDSLLHASLRFSRPDTDDEAHMAGPITSINCAGTRVVVGDLNGQVNEYSSRTNKLVSRLADNAGPISKVLCAGDFILASSLDGTIRTWDHPLPKPDEPHPINSYIKFNLLNLAKTVNPKLFTEHKAPVLCMQQLFSVNLEKSVIIASGSADNRICVWNVTTREVKAQFVNHSNAVTCLHTSLHVRDLLSGSKDCTAQLWDLEEPATRNNELPQPKRILRGHSGPITCVKQIGCDSAITSSTDRTVRIWDKRQRKAVAVLRGHTGPVTVFQDAPDWTLVTGSADSSIRIWDLRQTKCMFVCKEHTERVTSTLLLKKKTRIFSTSEDCLLCEWDVQTGNLLHSYQTYSRGVSCMAVSENCLITASFDASLRIWPRQYY